MTKFMMRIFILCIVLVGCVLVASIVMRQQVQFQAMRVQNAPQPSTITNGSATEAPTATATIDAVYVEGPPQPLQTQIPTPPPTATPPPYEGLSVKTIEPISTGPFLNVSWSPDGTKALVSKKYTRYLLVRNKNSTDKSPENSEPLGTSIGLGDLWLVDLATNHETLLLEQVGRYTWSPTGNQIAYINPIEDEGIQGELYVLDLATAVTTTLAIVDFLGSDYDPQWLPTNQIVFVRQGQILSVDASGKNESVFLESKFYSWVAVEARQEEGSSSNDAIVFYQFSSTGERLAYLTMHQNRRALASQLWLANADGTDSMLITGQALGFEWSSDGKQLVMHTLRDLADPNLDERLPPNRESWLVNADGKNARRLHSFQGWGGPTIVSWSPDNTKLLFLQLEFVEIGSYSTIWVADLTVDGKAGVIPNIIEKESRINGLWWEPNGNSLIVTEEISEGKSTLSSKRVTLHAYSTKQ